MPQEVAFDLYDERWRDCWVAATSTARLRKKQVDFDINQRVVRLLQDYGPQTDKPLTLRVYGTMIKGFCVLNNERARALFSDCERVVLMFARQPFTEGDNKIRLPAAKRQRMEAALTLDLDLARVEASEAFDWTQAPLEEGALLRLGAGGHVPQEVMLPSIELTDQALPQLLDPATCEAPSGAAPDGWLPRFGDESSLRVNGPAYEDAPKGSTADVQMADPLMSQILAMGAHKTGEMPASELQEPQGAPGLDLEALALQASRKRRQERAQAALLRPGKVFGFDADPMMPTREYEEWQEDCGCLCQPRLRASEYAEMLTDSFQKADHLGQRLRLLVDPCDGFMMQVQAGAARPQLPEVQNLLSAPRADPGEDQAGPGHSEVVASLAERSAIDDLAGGPVPMQEDYLPAAVSEDAGLFAGLGSEAQDDRTAEVGGIIRSCLRGYDSRSATFDTLVPPGQADRATAACTFAALLALASAGELLVEQAEPYAAMVISEAC
mmetsp:Transcript_104338/g.185521  ORF Transcript_104338/g.185521 Transcript_104338/m.185521 type:complete len:496 (-) Transcript_104338:28-1515(-)